MQKTHINCDSCNADLTDAGAMPTYYLKLQAARMAGSGGFQYAVHVSPPIKEDMDFCSKRCLAQWLNPISVEQPAL